MSLITLCVFVMEAQWYLLGTKFVIGRTAIYFSPLFFLFLVLLWSVGRLFEPSVNFYRVRYDLPYLQRAHRGGPFDRFDYYYLFDRDDPDLRDRRIRMRLTEELRNGLETIKSYDVSNTVLAVPRD